MEPHDRRDGIFTRGLTRFTMHPDGRLRAGRLLAIAGIAGIVVALGTTIALVVAGAGSPATLTAWVVASFLGVKVPLLALLWWILGRRQRDVAPSPEELGTMMARLEGAVPGAVRSPDASDRLEILRDEAWYVADNASDDLRARATELAMRIEALRQERTPGVPAEHAGT